MSNTKLVDGTPVEMTAAEIAERQAQEAAWAAEANARLKAQQEANRKLAYEAEADPLFFMSQRGEATVEEWQAKVAEIKARYPYPEETQA
jgi:hypothetical protein